MYASMEMDIVHILQSKQAALYSHTQLHCLDRDTEQLFLVMEHPNQDGGLKTNREVHVNDDIIIIPAIG